MRQGQRRHVAAVREHRVALAGPLLQPTTNQHLDAAVALADGAVILERRRRARHRRARDAQRVRDALLRQFDGVRPEAIVHEPGTSDRAAR